MNTLVCDVCGCHYEACLSCKDKIALEPWKMHTDTAEHYKVYAVLLGYNTGVYDISEAYEKLQNIDLCDKDTYRVEVKEVIDKILAYEKQIKKADKKPVEVKTTSKKGKKKANKTVETEKQDD